MSRDRRMAFRGLGNGGFGADATAAVEARTTGQYSVMSVYTPPPVNYPVTYAPAPAAPEAPPSEAMTLLEDAPMDVAERYGFGMTLVEDAPASVQAGFTSSTSSVTGKDVLGFTASVLPALASAGAQIGGAFISRDQQRQRLAPSRFNLMPSPARNGGYVVAPPPAPSSGISGTTIVVGGLAVGLGVLVARSLMKSRGR